MSDIKRTPNFTAHEEEALLQLVLKYKDILECKTTDSINNRKKSDTWNIVENDFNRNGMGSVLRTGTILKNKYGNLKKRLLKKIGNEKAGIRDTGGGPYQQYNYDENEIIICEILGDKRLGRQCSQYDDNADLATSSFTMLNNKQVSEQFSQHDENVYPVASTSYNILDNNKYEQYDDDERSGLVTFPGGNMVPVGQAILEEEVEDIFEDTVLTQKVTLKKNKSHVWSGNTTPLLRTKFKECLTQNDEEPILHSKKKQRLNDQLSSWASGKISLAKLQEDAFAKQSLLKLQIMKEESEARIAKEKRLEKLMKEEIEARMAREERLSKLQEMEVQIRIDILKKKL